MNNLSSKIKHDIFSQEPMGDKPVTEIAGIDEVLGRRLEKAGFDKIQVPLVNNLYQGQAYAVLGQFLMLRMDSSKFKGWLMESFSANGKQSADCYKCLKKWCDKFLVGDPKLDV